MTTTTYTIKGKLFAYRPPCPHCGIEHTETRGVITGPLGDDLIIVQYFDLISGTITWGRYILPRSELVHFVLYDSADEMAEHYKYGGVDARDEQHMEECLKPRWDAELKAGQPGRKARLRPLDDIPVGDDAS